MRPSTVLTRPLARVLALGVVLSLATTGLVAGPSGATGTAPNPPTNVQVTPGDGQVSVSWDAPTSNGYPVYGYTATATDVTNAANGGQTCSTDPAAGAMPTGFDPVAEALSSDGTTLYVANATDDTISVIDTSTGATEYTVNLGGQPTAVAISPGGDYLVVSLQVGAVEVFSTSDYSVVNTTRAGMDIINALAFGDDSTVYLGATDGDIFSLAMSPSAAPEELTTAPDGIESLQVDTTANTLYAITTDYVEMYDLANPVTPVTGRYAAVNFNASALSPDGSTLYVVSANNGVYLFSTADLSPVGGQVYVAGSGPNGIAVSPDGSTLYVSDSDGTILALDASTGSTLQTMSVPSAVGLALSPDGSTLYALDQNDYLVYALNTTTGTYPTGLSCAITGLTNGDTYSVSVTAAGSSATSSPSAPSSPFDPTGVPGAPGSPSATPSTSSASVSWSPADPNGSAVYEYDVSATDTTNAANGGETCSSSSVIPTAAAIEDAALNPAGTVLYTVGDYGSVQATSTATDQAEWTTTLGTDTLSAVVVSPDGTTLYVIDYTQSSVIELDANNGAQVATVSVGSEPYFGVLSSDGSTLYVTNYNSGSVSVIDTATMTVTSTISGLSGVYPEALSPDGSTLYVADYDTGVLEAVDVSTGTVSWTTTVGTDPYFITVSPDGSTVYVVNESSSSVSVVDAVTTNVTATVTTAADPYFSAISPDGSTLYVTTDDSSHPGVEAIDTATDAVTAVTALPESPWIGALSPDGSTLYVSNDNGVLPIDTSTLEPVAPPSTCTLTGLTSGDDYTATVTADNAAGTSAGATTASFTPRSTFIPPAGGSGSTTTTTTTTTVPPTTTTTTPPSAEPFVEVAAVFAPGSGAASPRTRHKVWALADKIAAHHDTVVTITAYGTTLAQAQARAAAVEALLRSAPGLSGVVIHFVDHRRLAMSAPRDREVIVRVS